MLLNVSLTLSIVGRNGRECRCSNGLELQFDGSCVPHKSLIVYASSEYLRAVAFPPQGLSTHEALPVLGGRGIHGVDFHFESKSVVWIEDASLVKIMNLNFSWVSFMP